MKKQIMDGNEACSYVAYNFSEVAGIYPITPASTMAELVDKYAKEGRENFFGTTVKVVEMQSEAGAMGMVHGSLQAGLLTTTFTASQGLLLMIPNMYKVAGEMLPCVINVAARTIATHALSIMGDHSDIYAVRQTGFAMLSSSSVQDVMNLTAVSYLSSIDGSLPFINFFDGFRTSHEMNKINLIDLDKVKELINYKKIDKFRKRALNIDNPVTRGTNQGDSIFFENTEARNKYYEKLPDIVNSYMEKINSIANTTYKPFNYYGDNNADRIIIAMGSVNETIKETVDYLNSKGEHVGLIEVHLYRPFSIKYFLDVLPKTVKRIAVLDRTKEPGSNGEPLYLDVVETLKGQDIDIIGGRYGLSSKNTTPNDIEAVYEFLNNSNKFNGFTIGINDDVTNLSLKRTDSVIKKDVHEMLIYGYGSDGMVTASKDILKIVGLEEDKYVQGYFEYDSKKSGGVTKSHLRFSNKEIKSPYYVNDPYLVVCTKESYLKKYNILKNIKESGILILNIDDDINNILTKEDIEIIRNKNIKLFIVDANKISRENNIPNKISMIMEAIIFKCSNLLDFNIVLEDIKTQINKNFARKGQEVIDNNINALNMAIDNLKEVDITKLISNLNKEISDDTLFSKLEHLDVDKIKVSDFENRPDGTFAPGTSKLEKRDIATIVPNYNKDKCAMCNLCSLVCPHAVIRPFLLDSDEIRNAPKEVLDDLKDSKIDDNLKFTIGISIKDCTGCSLCSKVCPTKALEMKEFKDKENKKLEYLFNNVTDKDVMPRTSIKGSQFKSPYFEFSGACAGCGETPYIKLLTQLFGENMVVANATGCSSIYGASLPSTPYTIPWINSLFEDNAEFGFGIKVADNTMKDKIKKIMQDNLDKVHDKNKELFKEYLGEYGKEVSNKVYNDLDYENIKELEPLKSYIKEKSVWIIGGDGWAYDIGFGGIDHVLSMNEDVNILVLDTEVYSNTGGQSSKSTRMGAVAKFAASGKRTHKKDLATIAMNYPNTYVATISLGADYNQTIKAMVEAEKHNGPSIIIAYAPCIAHGIKLGMQDSNAEQKLVTKSGYFPLFRYSPEEDKLYLDSQADYNLYDEIYERENRYKTSDKRLFDQNKEEAIKRYEKLKELADKN